MNCHNPKLPALALLCLCLLFSCKRDEQIQAPYNGFPVEVGQIMIDKCATTGCHTDQAFIAEGRQSLESWESAFRGSRNGATIIPYRTDYSWMLYFVNQDTTQGPMQTPRMPFNERPLSSEEVEILRQWIADGAPSNTGKIKFEDSKDKLFITNQGCDVVAVVDRESRLVMRYVNVGETPGAIESPHQVKVSPDGRFFYVTFNTGGTLEKYSTADLSFQGRANIGKYDWNTIAITPDGRYGFAVAYTARRVYCVNLETMTPNPLGVFSMPESVHGSCVSPDGSFLYITLQDGNQLYKLSFTDPFIPDDLSLVDLYQNGQSGSLLGPHEVAFLPEGDKFAVTCQAGDEVRFYNAAEQYLGKVEVGNQPVEMSASASRKYLFVTCMDDTLSWPGTNRRGSVAVIDYQTMSLVKTIYTGYQPHGIFVDDQKGLVFVSNRNVNSTGPAPHHTSACGGRNGSLTLIDMNTLELVPKYSSEMSSDPYSIAGNY